MTRIVYVALICLALMYWANAREPLWLSSRMLAKVCEQSYKYRTGRKMPHPIKSKGIGDACGLFEKDTLQFKLCGKKPKAITTTTTTKRTTTTTPPPKISDAWMSNNMLGVVCNQSAYFWTSGKIVEPVKTKKFDHGGPCGLFQKDTLQFKKC